MKSRKLLIGGILLLLCGWEAAAQQPVRTLEDAMNSVSTRWGIRFVYDASIRLDQVFKGQLPATADSLDRQRPDKEQMQKWMKDLFRQSGLDYEVHRKYVVLTREGVKPEEYDILEDTTRSILLTEAHVSALRDRKLNFTQTGFKQINGASLKKGVSFLSQPDVVKNLQLLPGVASGTELLSGFYVHGGNGRDNLFQLDGVEIYNISHLAGLFSSFNVDVVEGLGFYKSGFPARYGGKLSSIVDVRTKAGDLYEHHGSFSIGLLNASVQVDGPILKGKTSYNFGWRRSWLDPITSVTTAILNRKSKDFSKMDFRYAMTDLNGSVTHHFNSRNQLSLNLYAGQDLARYGNILPQVEYWNQERFYGEDQQKFGMRWGNLLASLNWGCQLSEELKLEVIAYHTLSMTSLTDHRQDWTCIKENEGPLVSSDQVQDDSDSRIQDDGVKAGFQWVPDARHHIHFGADVKAHRYRTGYTIKHQKDFPATPAQQPSTLHYHQEAGRSDFNSGELDLYAEDEMNLLDWFQFNLGARYALFKVPGKTYGRLEPRAALSFRFTPDISLRMSYTEMNQFTHRMSTHTLDLPTFSFLPSNKEVCPMNSRQIAAGLYTKWGPGIRFNLEGYYKTMGHLMEYKGQNFYAPVLDNWQDEFSEGKGRAWGMETELSWTGKKAEVTAYYTLSWNERYFRELYPDWFPDSHDNRHKFTLTASWRFNRHFDLDVAWHYHTGDRMTQYSQYQIEKHPDDLPDRPSEPDQPEFWKAPAFQIHQYYLTRPNNYVLPDYHRLDIGFNYRKTTRRGQESIWNISLYNAYCHVNTVFAEFHYDEEKEQVIATGYGLVPIIPMFSWTLQF